MLPCCTSDLNRREEIPYAFTPHGSLVGSPGHRRGRGQKPILAELMADPKFKNLVYFTIDFDSQKDLVRRFGARMQSTLISFIGSKEQGRSVGDSNRASISDLLNLVL
jgi:hypothetical protein